MLLSFVGCAQKNATASTTAKATTGPITITIAHFNAEGAPGPAAVFFPLIAKYMADNQDITIESDTTGHDDYQTKIETMIASNSLPDIYEYRGGMMNDLVKNNLAIDLNDILDKDQAWKNQYLIGAFDDFTKNGSIYALPTQFAMTAGLIFYNRTIFSECGIEVFPKTWSEFIDAIKKIEAKGYIPIGLGNKAGWPLDDTFGSIANRMTGTEWFTGIEQKTGSSFTDAVFVQALDRLVELRELNAFNADANSLDYNLGAELYNQKKAAMLGDGSWLIGSLQASTPKDVFEATEIAFFPTIEGGQGDPKAVCGGAGWGWGFNTTLTGRKLDVSLDIMKKFTGSESAKALLLNGTFPPAIVPDFNPTDYSSLMQKYFNEIVNQYADLGQCYSVRLPSSLTTVYFTGIQDLLACNLTAQQVANEMQKEYENVKVLMD
jgi:raffinose/stachyose/melibiose transport system substrate-binding protein